MAGKTDIIKGRIKEAAGVLTGNESLREEGQTDQAIGKVKSDARRAVNAAKKAARAAASKIDKAGQ